MPTLFAIPYRRIKCPSPVCKELPLYHKRNSRKNKQTSHHEQTNNIATDLANCSSIIGIFQANKKLVVVLKLSVDITYANG